MSEVCCGTTCNKHKMEQRLKCQGAEEFVAYLERHITEDCSKAAIAKLLAQYKMTVQGLHINA